MVPDTYKVETGRISNHKRAGKLFHSWVILCFLNLAACKWTLFLMDVCMGSFGIFRVTRDNPPVFPLTRMMNWLPTGCFSIMQPLKHIATFSFSLLRPVHPLSWPNWTGPKEDIKACWFSPTAHIRPMELVQAFLLP